MRPTRRDNLSRNPAIFIAPGLVTLLLCNSAIALCQIRKPLDTVPPSLHNQSRASGYRFQVVSIKPSHGAGNWMVGTVSDEYRAIGVPLAITLMQAYFPFGYLSDRKAKSYIQGAPKWLWTERYDFVAKVAPEDLALWQKARETSNAATPNKILQEMLRAALKERCKLVVHRVPLKMQGYALALAKGGPNRKHLRLSKPNEQVPSGTIKLSLGGRLKPIERKSDVPTAKFFHTSMASLAAMLPTWLGAPVQNRTGLTGRYDFSLIRIDTRRPPPSAWDWHWLGLKLIRVKTQGSAVVINHIQQPSPN